MTVQRYCPGQPLSIARGYTNGGTAAKKALERREKAQEKRKERP